MILIEKTYTNFGHPVSDEVFPSLWIAVFVAYYNREKDPTAPLPPDSDGLLYSTEVFFDNAAGQRCRRWVGLYRDEDSAEQTMKHHGLDSIDEELKIPYEMAGISLEIRKEIT